MKVIFNIVMFPVYVIMAIFVFARCIVSPKFRKQLEDEIAIEDMYENR